ncbi:MAG: hypothetical protein ACLFPQ_01245 [Candidatus Woesearchaeota archaeon]
MELGEKKLKSLRQMPLIESRVSKSKDGKWVIQKTTITHIKPVQYYEAILASEGEEEVAVSEDMAKDIENAKQALEG